MNQAYYGPRKVFKTSAGNFIANTKDEATRKARAKTGDEPTFVRGPKYTDSARGEPKGNRKNSAIDYLGISETVRRMNRARA